jgi:plastocyanin
MIMIDSFKFTTPLTVSPGATVSVMNMDNVNHTVTSDRAGLFDDNATAGQTTTFTAPTTPGSYPYHCTYHSTMHGVLIVK